MKNTLLMLMLVFTALSSKNAMADIYCCCFGNGIYEINLEDNVKDFMLEKRNVAEVDILSIEVMDTNYYLPGFYKPLIEISLIGLSKEDRQSLRQCERECLSMNFEKNVYSVRYMQGEQECTQRLFVKAKKNPFTGSIKTKVLKKEHPVCN